MEESSGSLFFLFSPFFFFFSVLDRFGFVLLRTVDSGECVHLAMD